MFDQSRALCGRAQRCARSLWPRLFSHSAEFSFGYVLGFYFYTMILGYLWLVAFSRFNYDHALATISAFGSALAFLVPALFITSPIRQRYTLSARALENLLSVILIFAAMIVAAGAFYNFRLVGVADIYRLPQRTAISGVACLCQWARRSSALLPFAFACFVARGHRWRAALVLVLLLLFYPITLTQTSALCSGLAAVSDAALPLLRSQNIASCCHCFCPYRLESFWRSLSQVGLASISR